MLEIILILSIIFCVTYGHPVSRRGDNGKTSEMSKGFVFIARGLLKVSSNAPANQIIDSLLLLMDIVKNAANTKQGEKDQEKMNHQFNNEFRQCRVLI